MALFRDIIYPGGVLMDKELGELVRILKSKAIADSTRLGILIALYYLNDEITFSNLRRDLEIPKSSLHFHLSILKDEGLISVKTRLTSYGPRTLIRITDAGRELIKKYLDLTRKMK